MKHKVPVILGGDHMRASEIIQHRIGTYTDAAAIRYALLEQARIIEREQAEEVVSRERAQEIEEKKVRLSPPYECATCC